MRQTRPPTFLSSNSTSSHETFASSKRIHRCDDFPAPAGVSSLALPVPKPMISPSKYALLAASSPPPPTGLQTQNRAPKRLILSRKGIESFPSQKSGLSSPPAALRKMGLKQRNCSHLTHNRLLYYCSPRMTACPWEPFTYAISISNIY